MSELTPSAEECEVDPDLMRRVALGMIAGKTKAAIAAAEGLTADECEIVCTAPGMFSIANVWVNFLERRKEAGRRNTRQLTGWCVDHVFEHAPERLNRNEAWRLDRLSSVMLHYGFAIVFVWMLGFLDGVMGVQGSRRKDLGDFKQNLVDLLCWAIEVTFREKMLEQYSIDLLIAKDGAFQAAIAGREYFEFGLGGEPSIVEKVVAERDLAETAEVEATSAPRRNPAMTRRRPRPSRPSLSWPADQNAGSSVQRACSRRGGAGRARLGVRATAAPHRAPAIRSARARPPPTAMISLGRCGGSFDHPS